MFATIIFANMCARDSSRFSLSTQNTRFLTHLPRLWHKMTSNVIAATCVASNLPQATKVRECYKIEYFGTYIRYLPTNPTSPHCDTFPTNPRSIPAGSKKFQDTKNCGISMFLHRNSLELVMHHTCSCLT